jgi:hypothetical protein
VYRFTPDFQKSEILIDSLEVKEGERYTFANGGYLIKVSVNAETGMLDNEEIEYLPLI